MKPMFLGFFAWLKYSFVWLVKREGYKIEAIEGDMTKTFPYEDESFDIVFHPVSNCYTENMQHIFNEAHRVLKKWGIFLAGLNNEINYIVDKDEKEIVWKMSFNPLNGYCQTF